MGQHDDLLGKSLKDLVLINTIEQRNLAQKLEAQTGTCKVCAEKVNDHEKLKQRAIGFIKAFVYAGAVASIIEAVCVAVQTFRHRG